jgi:serine/threonine protein kinase
MGEVYRARDTRLKRDVALKVLPESFAADPERLSRFQREAEVLASLNHPNIAIIHGLEEQTDVVSGFSRTTSGKPHDVRPARWDTSRRFRRQRRLLIPHGGHRVSPFRMVRASGVRETAHSPGPS